MDSKKREKLKKRARKMRDEAKDIFEELINKIQKCESLEEKLVTRWNEFVKDREKLFEELGLNDE
ncbi:MAG: hypothetical protein KGY74_05350 [Candidatus Cloacimonetes bacterium]|nr:hypothetical protein [Candidatus Cloacimonadota bacterium]